MFLQKFVNNQECTTPAVLGSIEYTSCGFPHSTFSTVLHNSPTCFLLFHKAWCPVSIKVYMFLQKFVKHPRMHNIVYITLCGLPYSAQLDFTAQHSFIYFVSSSSKLFVNNQECTAPVMLKVGHPHRSLLFC